MLLLWFKVLSIVFVVVIVARFPSLFNVIDLVVAIVMIGVRAFLWLPQADLFNTF